MTFIREDGIRGALPLNLEGKNFILSRRWYNGLQRHCKCLVNAESTSIKLSHGTVNPWLTEPLSLAEIRWEQLRKAVLWDDLVSLAWEYQELVLLHRHKLNSAAGVTVMSGPAGSQRNHCSSLCQHYPGHLCSTCLPSSSR